MILAMAVTVGSRAEICHMHIYFCLCAMGDERHGHNVKYHTYESGAWSLCGKIG
jgi:hypothetical protein